MKINFDTTIKNLKGDNMKTMVDGKEVELTLKDVSVNALLNEIPRAQNEPAPTGRQKLQKYTLSQKIFEGGEVEVTAEDITLIKEAIGQGYSTLIVGSSYSILEQESSPVSKE